ncbi:MAG: Wzz/FepE/Etk N-terminal domain-containing protein [Candidatus Omnitrophica bacterium]|nr:Wzz/FepE/Etk N-terminal domain-containing protein [Candidatus Omnitrophota bacterium]
MENQESVKQKHPIEYLRILFRRKWLFIVPVFIGLVLGIGACFLMPPLYESNTLILVEEEKIINPLIQDLAVSTTAFQRMQTIKEQLLGWNSLVELTKKLDLAKNVNTQYQFEELIMGLRKNINVQMRGQNIIRITYFGKNPQETRLITKTLTDLLVEENMRSQTKEADLAVEFIKEQLAVYRKKIKESEIADLQDQLKNLLVDSTEKHPLVKELRQKLETAQKELASGDYKVPEGDKAASEASYKALEEELGKITKDAPLSGSSVAYASNPNDSGVYDPNVGIYKLMLMDKLASTRARDKDVNEKIYNMLLQKLETAKITQRLEASKQGTRYTIIDPPRTPLRPTKPNKIAVTFMGMLLGCCSGAGLVFGREFMDQSFLDIDDAKQILEFPILGAISRLTTQEEIAKEIHKKKKFITIGLATSGVFILIALLIFLLRK